MSSLARRRVFVPHVPGMRFATAGAALGVGAVGAAKSSVRANAGATLGVGVAGNASTGLGTFGPHLIDWTNKPGDQVLVMPNGVYDGQFFDVVASTHAATGGLYNGWLILVAETPFGVTIDLTDHGPGNYRGGLNMRYDWQHHGFVRKDLRILFVGMNFDGMIETEGINYLRFYYCHLTNDPYDYDNQYRTNYFALHGFYPGYYGQPNDAWDTTGMGNWTPSCIRSLFCGSSYDSGIQFHCCDFQDVGDDAVFDAGSQILLQGCRFDNCFHLGVNYRNVVEATTSFHSDCYQTTGGSSLKVRDSSFNGHFNISTDPGDSVTLDFDRWLQYGHAICFQFYTVRSHHIVGTMKNGQWFANGQIGGDLQTFPSYNAPFDRMILYTDGDTGAAAFGTSPAGLHWLDPSGTEISVLAFEAAAHVFLSGVSQDVNGILSPDWGTPGTNFPRTPTEYDHVDNVAVIYRAAAGHGVNDWSTYFTGSWS